MTRTETPMTRHWQPMHTAPNDGTEIELRCAGSDIRRAQWGS